MRRKVMLVFGTRPEAIKLAPVILALEQHDALEPVVTVTAQHRVLLDQVLAVFGIRPQYDCNLIRPRQSLTELTSRALRLLSPLVETEAPALVVVQGDTTTAFAGALAAFYHRVPVAHVEAGLRTGDPYAPYPEEVNRRLIAQLASLHLASTTSAASNLRREGVAPERVVVTGNTVIDALLLTVAARAQSTVPALAGLRADGRRVVLVTMHRRESWGAPMRAVARALVDVARRHPDVVVVCPLHPNPTVREAVVPIVAGQPNVLVIEPLPYGDFCQLLERSYLIVTDSGGIQEEAPSLGKPVLVLRDNTERPEGVAAGNAELVGTDELTVAARIDALLDDRLAYDAMRHVANPYGDGQAATRTVAAFSHLLWGTPRPEDFHAQTASRSWSCSTGEAAKVVLDLEPARVSAPR